MENEKNNPRDFNMDLLRILASFMVVVIHVTAYNWYIADTRSTEWIIYNIYDSTARCAVPIFLMISGVFFLNDKIQTNIKKIYTKYISKLVITFIIWSLIYIGYILFFRHGQLDSILATFIVGHLHLWYIPVIIGIYIISPLLYRIIKNCDKKIVTYFIWLFIISSTLKTISYFEFLPGISYIRLFLDNLPINIICQFYSYFLLGYFLYNYEISKKNTNTIYVLSIGSILLCILLTYFLSTYTGQKNLNLYTEFSIFTLMEAMGLFLLFKNSSFREKDLFRNKVTKTANCTLGIYLIHLLVMYILFDNNLIQITSFNVLLSVPIISIIVFFLSLCIVYLIKKIKFIGKWLF